MSDHNTPKLNMIQTSQLIFLDAFLSSKLGMRIESWIQWICRPCFERKPRNPFENCDEI